MDHCLPAPSQLLSIGLVEKQRGEEDEEHILHTKMYWIGLQEKNCETFGQVWDDYAERVENDPVASDEADERVADGVLMIVGGKGKRCARDEGWSRWIQRGSSP